MNKHPLLFSLTGKRGYKKVNINCSRFWLSVPGMRKLKFKFYHLQNLMLWISPGWCGWYSSISIVGDTCDGAFEAPY